MTTITIEVSDDLAQRLDPVKDRLPEVEEVCERAQGCCEYCLLHHDDAAFPHEPDHIVAKKHDGPTHSDNPALACFRCNRFKGSDLGSIDPETGEFAFFFNPRTHKRQRSQHAQYRTLRSDG